MTKGSPRDRLATLQQGNAQSLRGIAAWRGLLDDEARVHRQFAKYRIRGEWFYPGHDLMEFVLFEGGGFCDWEKHE